MTDPPVAVAGYNPLKLRKFAAWPGIRVLAWRGDLLYGCRGYEVVCLDTGRQTGRIPEWKVVARFRPSWLRDLTSHSALSSRLMRDGFHCLAFLDGPTSDPIMVGAVAGAIVTRVPASDEFHVSHQIQRGKRPLHITAVPSGRIYWGEYFDNRERKEVHIYASTDRGRTWQIAYTFPAGSIRHVHNIVYDRLGDCLWVLTGDEGAECKVLCADCDLRSLEVVLAGDQQARAVAAIPVQNGLYLATDTPFEKNHIYRLDRKGEIEEMAGLASSSIYGCQVGAAMFFSTMVEPSRVNTSREVNIVGTNDGANWQVLVRWKKDSFPMRYFQYGNALLPDGENSTAYLAATTIAVKSDDLATTLWEVEST